MRVICLLWMVLPCDLSLSLLEGPLVIVNKGQQILDCLEPNRIKQVVPTARHRPRCSANCTPDPRSGWPLTCFLQAPWADLACALLVDRMGEEWCWGRWELLLRAFPEIVGRKPVYGNHECLQTFYMLGGY